MCTDAVELATLSFAALAFAALSAALAASLAVGAVARFDAARSASTLHPKPTWQPDSDDSPRLDEPPRRGAPMGTGTFASGIPESSTLLTYAFGRSERLFRIGARPTACPSPSHCRGFRRCASTAKYKITIQTQAQAAMVPPMINAMVPMGHAGGVPRCGAGGNGGGGEGCGVTAGDGD